MGFFFLRFWNSAIELRMLIEKVGWVMARQIFLCSS